MKFFNNSKHRKSAKHQKIMDRLTEQNRKKENLIKQIAVKKEMIAMEYQQYKYSSNLWQLKKEKDNLMHELNKTIYEIAKTILTTDPNLFTPNQ